MGRIGRTFGPLALAFVLVLFAAACSSSDGDAADDNAADETSDDSSTDDPTGEDTAAADEVATPTGPPPTTADHWHAPYGVYVCDETGEGFVQAFQSLDNPEGIYSQADGIIHVNPLSEASSGPNATLGKFFEAAGLELSDDAIAVAGGEPVTEGFDCDGEPTVLQVARWHLDDLDADPEIVTEGLAAVVFETDLEVYTIAYLPEGADIPKPGSISALATLTDVPPDQIPVLPEGYSVARVEPPPPGESITGETPCPADDAVRATAFEQAPPLCIDAGTSYEAIITTSEGVVRVALDTDETPNTANNFIVLSRYGYYDDTALFRTDVSIDIIQGGSPTTNSPSDPGPGYTITDEGEFVTDEATGQLTGPYTYEAGDLVMARSAGPDSSGGQFFFAAGPNTALLDSQGTYLNFGAVVEGLDVLETILSLHVDDPASGLGGGPGRPVIVESVEIVEV